MQAILAAYERVKRKFPEMELRIWFSQGSYREGANEEMIAQAPPWLKFGYYHGQNTYHSRREPQIYPLLEDFAKKGGWLGVVPQFTHNMREVVPWTAAQFVHYRMTEFVSKKLRSVSSYIVPNAGFHPFNLVAVAEWGWHAKGRTPEEFARAYATVTGVADPARFAKWAIAMGQLGWDLVTMKTGSTNPNPFRDRGLTPEQIRTDLATAREAMALARAARNPDMVSESEYVLAHFEAADLALKISEVTKDPDPDAEKQKQLAELLDGFDRCGHLARRSHKEWTTRVAKGERVHPRATRSMIAVLRACDYLHEAVGTPFRIPDPRPEFRIVPLGEWQFPNVYRKTETILCDVSGLIEPKGARYHLTFDVTEGKTNIVSARLLSVANGKQQPLAECEDIYWSPLGKKLNPMEYALVAPEHQAESDLTLELKFYIRGGTSGVIGLRRIFSDTDFPQRGAKLTATARRWEQRRRRGVEQDSTDALPPRQAGVINVGVTEGYGADALWAVLAKQPGLEAFPLARLNARTLAAYDVLLVAQQRTPAALTRAVSRVKQWVNGGGGVLFFHDAVGYRRHVPMFPKLGRGLNHPKLNIVRGVRDHPVTRGLPADEHFKPGFEYDHVVIQPGPEAQVLIKNAEQAAVVVAGQVGKGRVLLNGMLCGVAGSASNGSGKPAEPTGAELRLFLNSVAWLAGRDEGLPKELFPNGGAERVMSGAECPSGLRNSSVRPAAEVPAGWGVYRGAGKCRWGATDQQKRSGNRAAFLTFTDYHVYEDGRKGASLYLLFGATDGYRGERAPEAQSDTTYRFSFWCKGDISALQVFATSWNTEAAGVKGRHSLVVSGVRMNGLRVGRNRKLVPGDEWARVTGAVTTRPDTKRFVVGVGLSNPVYLKPGQTLYVDDASLWVVP